MRLAVIMALGTILSGCATLQANIQKSQFAARCYTERSYADLIAADGCTERDIFNGQQQAENQARLQASLAQLQALGAEQAQEQAQRSPTLTNCQTQVSGAHLQTDCISTH